MKKVVVFGGSGFLGSHVADVLSEAGYKVLIYDLKPSAYLKKGQEMVVGDILDQDKVESALQQAEIAYNFAGIADIEAASQSPLDSVKANILGNAVILEACRKAKIKRFIFASTLYVFSKAGSLYRSTKQSCELLIENYQELFGLDYTILRYGSLYGPRAGEHNIIYRFVKQALTEKKISRYGDGEELREYIHVHDAAQGSVEALSDEFKNQHVIITGNQQMKIRDLLMMIREMLENKISIEYLPLNRNHHYEITPYTFAPKVGKRLVSRTYLDLSHGLLNVMRDVYSAINRDDVCGDLIIKER